MVRAFAPCIAACCMFHKSIQLTVPEPLLGADACLLGRNLAGSYGLGPNGEDERAEPEAAMLLHSLRTAARVCNWQLQMPGPKACRLCKSGDRLGPRIATTVERPAILTTASSGLSKPSDWKGRLIGFLAVAGADFRALQRSRRDLCSFSRLGRDRVSCGPSDRIALPQKLYRQL